MSQAIIVKSKKVDELRSKSSDRKNTNFLTFADNSFQLPEKMGSNIRLSNFDWVVL
jgi:hypothetical protein